MNKLITVAAATLAATITLSFASSAFALPLPIFPLPKLALPHHGHNHDLSCRVRGDNIFLTNFGDANADSGRQVEWASTTGDQGTLTLPKMLAPGEEVMIADVLFDAAGPGDECQAAFA